MSLQSEEDAAQQSKLPFGEKGFICAVRFPVGPLQTHPLGFCGATACMSGCLCPLLAESVMGVLFALLCQHVRPDPFGRTWEKTLILRYSSQLSRLCAATPHCTVKSAGRPVAVSASSSGQTGHAGGITPTGKIPLTLNPDEWILGEWDVWRKGDTLTKRAALFGSTINQSELHRMIGSLLIWVMSATLKKSTFAHSPKSVVKSQSCQDATKRSIKRLHSCLYLAALILPGPWKVLISWLHIQDVKRIHNIPKVLWIWWLWRPFKYNEVIGMFGESGRDYQSFMK